MCSKQSDQNLFFFYIIGKRAKESSHQQWNETESRWNEGPTEYLQTISRWQRIGSLAVGLGPLKLLIDDWPSGPLGVPSQETSLSYAPMLNYLTNVTTCLTFNQPSGNNRTVRTNFSAALTMRGSNAIAPAKMMMSFGPTTLCGREYRLDTRIFSLSSSRKFCQERNLELNNTANSLVL